MSIKSDKWIKRMSVRPTHRLFTEDGLFVREISPPYTEEESHAIANWCVENGRTKYMDRSHAEPICESFEFTPMIEPFHPELIRKRDDAKLISYGVTSYGYDVSLARTGLALFTNMHSAIIDPRKPNPKCFVEPEIRVNDEGLEYVILPPNSYLLGPTVEYFHIPRDVLVVCLGKSTYARAGIAINCTPIEPEFEGTVVIEIANQTCLPAMIYLEQGIAQFLFFQSDESCETSYKDRGGKYQGQVGLVHATV